MREFIDAGNGFVLTNGEIYGKRIYLAKGLDKSAFYEITDAEYEATMQNESMNQ